MIFTKIIGDSSERRKVRLLRIINNASVGRELRAHYSSGLEE
ncbi:hypothetical protein O5466_19630 [Escherichia coli]|nr:hypothetical protein [Escherichia coli]